MIQEGLPPDLTRSLPWWVPYAISAAVLLWGGWQQLKKRLRSADEAESNKIKVAIADALVPVEKELTHAKRLAELLEDENEQLKRAGAEKDARIVKLETRIAQYLEDEVEAQKKMALVIGKCSLLETKLAQLEAQHGGG